jgi:glycosyltransferase involved in cell wall biosynthesis
VIRHDLSKKIVFLRLNRLDYVPSGLYAAEILTEGGYDTLAIEYGFFQKGQEEEKGKVARLRLGHPWLRKLPSFLRAPLLHSLAALRIFSLFLRRGRPKLLIAQGLHEQAIAWILSRILRFPYAVHVHEVFEKNELRGWNRFFFLIEGVVLRAAVFTIFPQAQRAHIYQLRYRLKNPSYLAFNCPRKKTTIPLPTNWRAKLGLPDGSFLLGYWGGQGRTNGLDQAIRAVARLPRVYFLLWGWSSAEDRAYFKHLATGVGAGHRVLFLGDLPEQKWSALAGIDLSYCLYEPKELRLQHLATASNKLMESLSVGVPVLTNNEPDFRSLIEEQGLGVCTPDYTVEGISRTLRGIMENPSALSQHSAQATRVHDEFFHYEKQFQPVFRAIERLVPLTTENPLLETAASA